MTQFLSRTVVHVLSDWMKVCAFFRIMWSNSWGQQRPHQLAFLGSSVRSPLSASAGAGTTPWTGGPGIASQCRVLKDMLTKSIWGPWALATSPRFAFIFLLPKILTFLAPGPEAVRKGPRPGAARVQLGGGGDLGLVFLWSLVHTASGAQVLGSLQRAHGPHPRIQAGYIGQYFCHLVRKISISPCPFFWPLMMASPPPLPHPRSPGGRGVREGRASGAGWLWAG